MSSAGKLSGYQRLLMVYLALAAFFEGYDLWALSQTLPNLRATFSMTPAQGSRLVAYSNIGMLVAYLLTRLADRYGRRSILSICLICYPLISGLSALAPEQTTFLFCQMAIRVFLVSGLAVSVIYATEEYPVELRGTAVGLLQVCVSMGCIVCSVAAPFLIKSQWGWRSVYALGVLPLLLALTAPYFLRESQRFAALPPDQRTPPSLFRLLGTKYRTRMLQLAVIWAATYACTQVANTFWKEHATSSGRMSAQEIGNTIAIAAFVGLPLTLIAGRVIDALGRRRSAALVYPLMILSVLGAYWLPPGWLLKLSLIGSIAAASGITILLNTITAESFPTELRGDGMAWTTNLLGRLAFVASPLLVAQGVEIMGWAKAVSSTTLFLLLAWALLYFWIPPTSDQN